MTAPARLMHFLKIFPENIYLILFRASWLCRLDSVQVGTNVCMGNSPAGAVLEE